MGEPATRQDHPLLLQRGLDRDLLGQLVREAWVRWAKTQLDPKPHWLTPWEELSETDREADRQIGETIALWTIAHPAPSDVLEKHNQRLLDLVHQESAAAAAFQRGVQQGYEEIKSLRFDLATSEKMLHDAREETARLLEAMHDQQEPTIENNLYARGVDP